MMSSSETLAVNLVSIPSHPKVRASVESRRMGEGTTIVTAGGNAHLSLPKPELDFLLGLDGTRSISALAGEIDVDCTELLEDFAGAGLLESTDAPIGRGVNLTRSGIEFAGFHRFVAMVHDAGVARLLTRPGMIVILTLAVAGLLLLAFASDGRLTTSNQFPGPVVVLALSLSGIAASVLHETAHALVIRHKGRRVGAAGFGFYWGALSFYIDATDALLLPKKARLMQGIAGPMTDAALASALTAVALTLSPSSPWSPLFLQMSVLLWIDVALNLCPILELDGYWAVADTLNRPQLREESYAAIRRLLSGERTPTTIRLACFGLASVGAGVALMGLSLWLWIHHYTDLALDTWNSGPVGKAAVTVWLLPTLLGFAASTIGRLKELLAKNRAQIGSQGEKRGGERT